MLKSCFSFLATSAKFALMGIILLSGCEVDEINETELPTETSENVSEQNQDQEKQTDKESKQAETQKEYNKLDEFERWVILNKGTERAFTGKLTNNKEKGTYICKRCNAPLYKSSHKFKSNCGWPSFDDEIKDAVRREKDADGYRVEILCKNCGGHLGHVFEGEGFTEKNIRHCVNSVSMKFVKDGKKLPPVVKRKSESSETKSSKTNSGKSKE